jgi:hypothetical protein
MNILFLQRPGVNLYETLLQSETSRHALRFYRPVALPGGISVTTSTLGSALSLVSELRWYVRRYMEDVLFEFTDEKYCTHILAREVYYNRSTSLEPPWAFRRLYIIRDGVVVSRVPLPAGTTREDFGGTHETDGTLFEVWYSENEGAYNESLEEPEPEE